MTKPRLASLIALLMAACTSSVPAPPGGALITCASSADCPDGFVCRATLGRCVRPGGDEIAPQLVTSSFVVTPVRVGRNTPTITVAFTVSEPLASDPQATLALSGPGGTTRQLSVVSRDAANNAYVMSYTPVPSGPGADPEGDVSFVATLIDAAGNQGHVELPHVAVFDFTPPSLAVDLGGTPIASVSFTPPATSPLRDVTAVTVGTRLRVDFAASEPLAGGAGAPVVTLGSGATAVTLSQLSGNGLSYVYETLVAAGLPEGPAPLTARLTDLAGNAADVAVGTVQVVTQRPATPAVGTAGAVTFHRLPWGSEATSGAQAYFMRGAAGAVPAGALAVVYSDPTVISAAGELVGREIGRIAADPTGAFGGDLGDPVPFQLFMGDAPDVYVASVDAAGNVSDADGDPSNGVQAALVRDVAWTATMLGKIPGRVFPNPHGFEGRQVWTPTLAQYGSKPVTTPAQVGRQDGVGAAVRGAPHWLPARKIQSGAGLPVSSGAGLAIRSGTGLAYDPVRGCRLAFGGVGWDGCDGGSFCGQWESCRGSRWSQPTVEDPEGDGTPSLGSGIPLLFAGGRGATVLSDGTDLWEWDGVSWRKLLMTDPEGDGNPAPRSGHAIAYDEARQRLVLFGGTAKSGGALLGDTWETDFKSWRRVCTSAPCTSTVPAARAGHAMVYDSARKWTLLVGGGVASGYDALTWSWNGSTWTSVAAGSPAAQRKDHGLSFDSGRGRAVVFGGTTASGIDGGLYELVGATWAAACTTAPCSTSKPIARTGASVYFDVDRARVVVASGFSGSGFGSGECPSNWCDTEWEWDGAAWTQVFAVPAGPPNVSGAEPVYDAMRDRVVLFAAPVGTPVTYLWDGVQWTTSAAAQPPARSDYGAAYVATGTVLAPNGYVAVAGGDLTSTYTWNGTLWTSVGLGPSARSYAPLAQSTRARPAGGALLFGGQDSSTSAALCDTWELSGNAWTNLAGCTGSPSARYGHAMVRAAGFAGAPVVLFGGGVFTNLVNDVWNWNGSAWAQVSAGGPASLTQPVARTDHGLLWDSGRSRVLLYGGNPGPAISTVNCVDNYGGPSCHDFWEWDGSAWARVFPVDLYGDATPNPGSLLGIAYDSRRQLGVGLERTGATLDTWWWHGGTTDRPGEVMSVVFDAAQVTRAFDVLDLQVTWTGGASGAPGGATTPGASLQVWDNQAWRPLVSSSTASPGAPETLRWALATDPSLGATPLSERQRFMVGDQRLLSFALVPAATSGSAAGFGEVSTDYVEVTVRYRLAAP